MTSLEAEWLKGQDLRYLRRDNARLEYAVAGHGEPVILLHPAAITDGLAAPLFKQQDLITSYKLIHYHRRGYGGSTKSPGSLSIAAQAADAADLLSHLGITAAHVVGHSLGGVIALQLAHDYPNLVHSVVLLEPSLTRVPSGAALRKRITASDERFRSGDKQGALDLFLTDAFGANWQSALEAAVPGAVSQAEADVDTFFDLDLPSLREWSLGDDLAGKLTQPILVVVGTDSPPFRAEGRQLLHEWFPQVEGFDLDGANHMLQLQNPEQLARRLAAFFQRHPL